MYLLLEFLFRWQKERKKIEVRIVNDMAQDGGILQECRHRMGLSNLQSRVWAWKDETLDLCKARSESEANEWLWVVGLVNFKVDKVNETLKKLQRQEETQRAIAMMCSFDFHVSFLIFHFM